MMLISYSVDHRTTIGAVVLTVLISHTVQILAFGNFENKFCRSFGLSSDYKPNQFINNNMN